MSYIIDYRNAKGTDIRRHLRKITLQARNQLSPTEVGEKSTMACELLWNLPAFQSAVNLFIYVSYHSELQTSELIRRCLKKPGCRVMVPRTLPGEGLDAYKINDLDLDLAPGFCSIPEPVLERVVLFEPSKIDVVILPGSVFDLNGGRLGYGGGYYDRFLANGAPQALRIGLAYEMQLVDEVPVMAHDQPLDYLVTEKRVIKFATETHRIFFSRNNDLPR